MSRVEDGRSRLILFGLAAVFGLVWLIAPAMASAADTTWICKPGQSDDLCAGTIDGETTPPPGEEAHPLGYSRPKHAPVDCFYLYPTQSDQAGPNANLDKDPPIRRVVVQQARMFSTVCDVYAPMYRQVTLNGDQTSYNASVGTAYKSAKAAFRDYLKNYNDGRGFILLGHSQGSAHTARLIDELVDTNPKLRERFVGAIAPGANISVPIGKPVGGLFENVPACTKVGEFGCVIAYSTYKGEPPAVSEFSRLNLGYWIYPEPRPDAAKYEVMCTDPARLDGGDGGLLPLVDFDYLTGAPDEETAAPWRSQPDYYEVSCERKDGAHWLNISTTDLPGDTRLDLGALVASGSNYHVPEVNLAEGNLLTIAQLQTDGYEAAVAKLDSLRAELGKAKARSGKHRSKVAKLKEKKRRAGDPSRRHALRKRIKAVKRKIASDRREIRSLKKRIDRAEQRLR
ncbi:MAG: DUF3089 domain-containing protein [Solirubrobacterales bacterium]|nr:DUF3089 domain-containing protein [Solirubrobacterales bacterium]